MTNRRQTGPNSTYWLQEYEYGARTSIERESGIHTQMKLTSPGDGGYGARPPLRHFVGLMRKNLDHFFRFSRRRNLVDGGAESDVPRTK